MRRLIFVLTFFLALGAGAQVIEPIKWNFSSSNDGQNAELVFMAVMEKGWHLYDTYLPEGGPIATSFVFEDTTLFTREGALLAFPEPGETFDPTFQMNLRYFSDTAVFRQKVVLGEGVTQIKGYVEFMGCDDEQCLPDRKSVV